MARYQLILSYDGTEFAGSQRQAGRRTVQGSLESALRKLGWHGRAIALAGRTDAGVHAEGQVAAFDLDWQHGTARLMKAIDAALPSDLACLRLETAAPQFHPRHDATSRSYRYRLFCSDVRQPLRERYAWRVWPPVELSALAMSAAEFLGEHDFGAFGSPSRKGSSTVRAISTSRWVDGSDLEYEIGCEGFLYRMVRRIVFVQVAAAQGRVQVQAVRAALEPPAARSAERSGSLPAGLAPASGLTLLGVEYGAGGSREKRSVESAKDLLSESR